MRLFIFLFLLVCMQTYPIQKFMVDEDNELVDTSVKHKQLVLSEDLTDMLTIVNWGTLGVNIKGLLYLYNNNGFFGTQKIDFSSEEPGPKAMALLPALPAISLLYSALYNCRVDKAPFIMLPLINGLTGIILVSNMAYHEAMKKGETGWIRPNIEQWAYQMKGIKGLFVTLNLLFIYFLISCSCED